MLRLFLFFLFLVTTSHAATIAIIDTGFDLDHEYLRPNILNKEVEGGGIDYYGWDFFDNSHLKKPVIEDRSSVQEILLYRTLKAKGHRQGLSVEEFQWFNKKSGDKEFMEKVKLFKKHSHGTFVAGIALREGENINIFPIRGLNIPNPIYVVEDSSVEGAVVLKGKNREEQFQDEVRQSIDRVSKKFSKICRFVASKKIDVVNASYGITFKSIMAKFRERYKEMTGLEIPETKLKLIVDDYFRILYKRGEKTMLRHPNILFVFSAGNSGLDNDSFHHYPSRIKVPNSITVAAMNGDFLATFSNFGLQKVDVGAPGVAILSLVPKVYSEDGADLYSPSSGTSMAAPYVANLAAQIKNANSLLTPPEIKRIILETGEAKEHLKGRLTSGAVVANQKALRAALLSKELSLDQAITLGVSDLIPMEDTISSTLPPAVAPKEMQRKVLDSIPSIITPQEVDEEPSALPPTSEESSVLKDLEKERPGKLSKPASALQDDLQKSSDLDPSSQTVEQFQRPSEEKPASSFQPPPTPDPGQTQESSLLSPQS